MFPPYRSSRLQMSSVPLFFVKMSVAALKPQSTKYVVGNGRSVCSATLANLAYLVQPADPATSAGFWKHELVS